PSPRYHLPLRRTLMTAGSQDSTHFGHSDQPPECAGTPPSRAGLTASAAVANGGRREPSHVRAAVPAAARRINPRLVKWFFINWFRSAPGGGSPILYVPFEIRNFGIGNFTLL